MGFFNKRKIESYRKTEMERLEKNLKKLSDGDFDIDLEITEGENCVQSEREQFKKYSRYLSKLKGTMNNLVSDAGSLTSNIENGNLDYRIDTTKYNGLYSVIGKEINSSLEAIIKPLNEASNVLGKMAYNDFTVKMEDNYKGQFSQFSDQINNVNKRLLSVQDAFVRVANGDISRLDEFLKVGKRSENDQLVPSIISMMQAVQSLVNEAGRLTQESINGNIKSARGNADNFKGGYKDIVLGVNDMLDTIAKPVAESVVILKKMAVNDYTQSMDMNYKGDYLEMANAINDVQKRLLNIQRIVGLISQGDMSELETLSKVGKRSENDHIVPALTNMMATIKGVITEITMVADRAINGDVDARGQADKFKGDYSNIINGINGTLDAIVKPVREGMEVMSKMEVGILSASMEGDYKGGYLKLKNSINNTTSSIRNVVLEISDIMLEIAKGNLNISNIKEFKGDFADISKSLSKTIRSLNETLRDINSSAEQVAAGARQISDTSQTLSQGSEEQASSIEQVTASITEMAAQVKQNATNANEANDLSLMAKDNAVKGDKQMKEMLQAMHDINESSSNISKIIKVIDEIAFQTNILALNAAVEAARAGQYGKGFAVVAEEVRNLAARSASAAKETTGMIESSIDKVENGTKIANETAKALIDIVDSITKASVLVGEIASASNEQASAIVQINQAVDQVSRVVQTNSATSEESASASEELSSQAEMMKQMVAKFKLKDALDLKSSNLEMLSPEVISALEEMLEKRNKKMNLVIDLNEKKSTPDVCKQQILLDDREFGKY